MEKIKKYLSDWGVFGAIVHLLFGKMVSDKDGQTLSSNRIFACICGVYGLIIRDYTLVGIGVGQALVKTGIDAMAK